MKEHGYAHRDIKAENVVIDANFNAKIIDWGFATPYQPGELCSQIKGTESYQAPEIHANEPYDAHKADMFSLGTLLYFLKTQQFPWPLAVKTS